MPYEEEDREFFFGRSREIRLIVANLFAAPVTVLLGSSGVGKSSILRAGVISALRERADVLPVICSNWRDEPLEEVRRAVRQGVEAAGPLPGVPAAAEVSSLPVEIRYQSRRAGRHLMIILDQFEELFLYHAANQRFFDEFGEGVNSSALNPRSASQAQQTMRHNVARAMCALREEQRGPSFRMLNALVTADGKRNTLTLENLALQAKMTRELAAQLFQGLEAVRVVSRRTEKGGEFYELTHELLAQAVHALRDKRDPFEVARAEWLGSSAPAAASYLISLREDALAKLDLFEGRIPELMERLLRIENLDRDSGREAIILPLEAYDRRREAGSPAMSIEPALVESVLDQVVRGRIEISEYTLGTRALNTERVAGQQIETAFLQLVMTRLWDEELKQGSSVLQLATLTKLENAEKIVRLHLDEVMARFPAHEQQVASRVFRFLITPSGSKVAHSASDLAGYSHDPLPVVERLLVQLSSGTDRILRPVPATPERPGEPRYEIFHDRLGAAILGWLSRFTSKEAATEAARQTSVAANSPISRVDVYEDASQDVKGIAPGTGLCLSGGGYRAMLFHVGALWRVNELGLLRRIDRVSSVSTGSFVAAKLGLAWTTLQFDDRGVATNLEETLVKPLRRLASRSMDAMSIVAILGSNKARRLVEELEEHLLGDATLAQLPDRPRFVLVASNMQNGAVWRFSKPYVGDHLSGTKSLPSISLAMAAAASAAIPPVLSPLRLAIPWDSGTRNFFLTDGLVLDRLAIETVWKAYRNVLVSDGAGKLPALDDPPADWMRQVTRVLDLVDWQARGAQKRQLIDSFLNGARGGTYWGIGSNISDYHLADSLACPFEKTKALAELPTRLSQMDDRTQESLINWGYAVSDAAIRRHYLPSSTTPALLPYPSTGI